MRRTLFLKKVMYLVVLFTCQQSYSEIRYAVTVIPTPPNCQSIQAMSINDSCHIAGQMTVFGEGQQAFIYYDQELTNIGITIEGAQDSIASCMNNNGQLIVDADIERVSRPYLYSENNWINLYESTGHLCITARSINDTGQITGTVRQDGRYEKPYIYCSGELNILDIPTDWANGYGLCINNVGEIAGQFYDIMEADTGSFIYVDGEFRDLGIPRSYPVAINNHGQVVGLGECRDGDLAYMYLYDAGIVKTLCNIGGGLPSGINDLGDIVGYICLEGVDKAFIYTDGSMMDLNELIDPALGWDLHWAADINNSGQIVCNGFNSEFGHCSVILTPIPEPCSLVLLCLGGLARRFRWN